MLICGLKNLGQKMTMNESTSSFDEKFVERLKNKDKKAFEELINHFGPNLFNFGMKMCGEREDALDIFQDTLEKAYTSLEQLKEPTSLKKWLFKVAANACLMKRRKEKIFSYKIDSEDSTLEPEILSKEDELENLPEAIILNKETKEVLRKIITSLPETYKSVLILRDIEDFSTEETAEILGLTKETVKMRLSRARAKVRNELNKIFKR